MKTWRKYEVQGESKLFRGQRSIGKEFTCVVVFVVQVGSNPKKEAKKSLEACWQADLHSSEKSI